MNAMRSVLISLSGRHRGTARHSTMIPKGWVPILYGGMVGAFIGVGCGQGVVGSVMCVTSEGTIAMRRECGASETPLTSGMLTESLPCPPDAEKVGPLCVDKYEASTWAVPPELVDKVKAGTVTLADLNDTSSGATATQVSLSEDGSCNAPFPSTFPATGNWSDKVFAVSVKGVTPTACVTWFQAEQACAASGKRLLTNQEWQRAAAGTPDGSQCNVSGTSVAKTGANPDCVSRWRIYDMVGNVWEWVADWDDLATNCTHWASDFGSDVSCFGGPGSPPGSVPLSPGYVDLSLPGAVLRGGDRVSGTDAGVFAITDYAFHIGGSDTPALSNALVGFRCAR